MRAAVALAAAMLATAILATACGDAEPRREQAPPAAPPPAATPAQFAVRGRWPTDPMTIRYRVETAGSPIEAEAFDAAVRRAAAAWSATGVVAFVPAGPDDESIEVTIGWRRGHHGACEPFGPNTDVAHTGPVATGTFVHFDAARRWSADQGPANSVFGTALHELGHVLGLGHSEAPTAVMSTSRDRPRALSPDDLAGLHSLYGGGDDAAGDLDIVRGDARLASLRQAAPATTCGFAVFDCTGNGRDEVLVWRRDAAGHGVLTLFAFTPGARGPQLTRTIGPFYGAVIGRGRIGCLRLDDDTRLLVTEFDGAPTLVRQFDRYGVPGLPQRQPTAAECARASAPTAGDLDGDGVSEQVVRSTAGR